VDDFNRLIAEHIPRLRRYSRALLRDRAHADDLLQDTLERAWDKRRLWRSDSNLRAWLFTIMHNVFVNQRRQEKSRPTVAMDEEALSVSGNNSAEQPVLLRDIENALEALSIEYREVVVLIGLEQLRYEEAAEVLNIPIGTVMSRLARGREKLRTLMSGANAPQLRRVK